MESSEGDGDGKEPPAEKETKPPASVNPKGGAGKKDGMAAPPPTLELTTLEKARLWKAKRDQQRQQGQLGVPIFAATPELREQRASELETATNRLRTSRQRGRLRGDAALGDLIGRQERPTALSPIGSPASRRRNRRRMGGGRVIPSIDPPNSDKKNYGEKGDAAGVPAAAGRSRLAARRREKKALVAEMGDDATLKEDVDEALPDADADLIKRRKARERAAVLADGADDGDSGATPSTPATGRRPRPRRLGRGRAAARAQEAAPGSDAGKTEEEDDNGTAPAANPFEPALGASPEKGAARRGPRKGLSTRFDSPRRENRAREAEKQEALRRGMSPVDRSAAGDDVDTGSDGALPDDALLTPDEDEVDVDTDRLYFVCAPSRKPLSEVVAWERDHELRIPSKPLIATNREHEPRRMEEEGFYVGARIPIGNKNRNRMEQRLYKEKVERNANWFDDGALVCLPNPVRKQYTRPEFFVDEDAPPPAIRTKAAMDGNMSTVAPLQRLYTLEIDIGQISFSDHTLFKEEDREAATLKRLYTQYVQLEERDVEEYWTGRLSALKQALSETNDWETGGASLDESYAPSPGVIKGSRSFRVADNIAGKSLALIANGGLPMSPGLGTSIGAGEDTMFMAAFNIEKRRAKLLNGIKDARDNLDQVEEAKLNLVHDMVKAWNEIKRLRAQQGFQTTGAKLEVQPVETDLEEDERRLAQELEERYEDLMESKQLEYEAKKMELEERVEARKKHQARKQQRAERRERKKAQMAATETAGAADGTEQAEGPHGSNDDGEDGDGDGNQTIAGKGKEEEDEEGTPGKAALKDDGAGVGFDMGGDVPMESSDEASSSSGEDDKCEELLRAHTPPVPEEVRAEVERTLAKKKRLPGQPILVPLLTWSRHEVDEVNNAEEEARRKELEKQTYTAHVIYNGKEVTESKPKPLEFPSYNVEVREMFSLKVYEWPKTVMLALHGKSKLAEVALHVPGQFGGSKEQHFESYEFTGEEIQGGVFKRGGGAEARRVKGSVRARLVWGADEAGQPDAPPPPKRGLAGLVPSTLEKLKEWADDYNLDKDDPKNAAICQVLTGKADLTSHTIQLLKTWVQTVDLDPNHPRNADLLAILRATRGHEGSVDSSVFRTRATARDLGVPGGGKNVNNWRVQLLRTREERAIQFTGPIPAHQRSITKDMFRDPPKPQDIVVEEESAYIRGVRAKVEEDLSKSDGRPEKLVIFEDIVKEAIPPDINVGFSLITSFFKPRRKLKPTRKARVAKVHAIRHCDMRIKIILGKTLPIRKVPVVQGDVDPRKRADDSVAVLSCYVEVLFQKSSTRTLCKNNENPVWNNSVELPVHAPNDDFSPSTLAAMDDSVVFNVFDQAEQRDAEGSSHMVPQLLGSLTIPFSTVFLNSTGGGLEGSFRLDVPELLPNHVRKRHDEESGVPMNPLSDFEPSLLKLFVTLLPSPQPLVITDEKRSTREDQQFIQHATAWLSSVKSTSTTANRHVEVLVADDRNYSVFISRYLTKENPPEDLIQNRDTAPYQLLAFVSSIPNVGDASAFASRKDVWNISEKFLHLGAGDEEEHAILLRNYFHYLGMEAYLVLGEGMPEGETCYVMTREPGRDVLFWNAHAGTVFEGGDSKNPLQSVGCLINGENVWANIQVMCEPWRISVDLKDTRAWKPLLTSRYGYQRDTVQDALTYTPPNEFDVLADSLQQQIHEAISTWRAHELQKTTRADRATSEKLRSLLKLYERHKQGLERLTEEKQKNCLRNPRIRLIGVPVHFAYTETEPIIEAVKSTKVHLSLFDSVKFSVGTWAHAYPNGIKSVWVYAAAVIPVDP